MEFAIQKTVSAEEVKVIRQRLHLKQKELADLMNVQWNIGKAARGR